MLTQSHYLIMIACLLAPGWLCAEDNTQVLRVDASEPAAKEVAEKQVAEEQISDEQIGDEQIAEEEIAEEEIAEEEALLVGPSSVQRRPAWEFGIGGGYFSGFDYPASKDANRRALALPFFIYRSPQFRFGGGGIRAVAIERPRLKLDLAIAASLNASSEGNSVREGMEDLDFLFEVGPQLELSLMDRPMASGGRVQMRLNAELRAVMETDFRRINNRGLIAELGLGINFRNVKRSGIDLLAGISTSYGNERLQDYFYEVDQEFVTETRPVFDAKGGYLGSRVFAGMGVSLRKNIRVFLGVFTGLYDGARNQESPLFETTSSTGFALGFVWTLKTSRRYVDIVDMGGER